MLQTILIVIFCVVVVLWEVQLGKEHSTKLLKHSQVIESNLWNLDFEGPLNYLELAAQLNNYEELAVYFNSGELFLKVKGPEQGLFDHFLTQIGVAPKIKLQVDVFHNSAVIGRMEASHRHNNIASYLYLLLILILILLVLRFFMHTIQVKDTLEFQVEQRTKELQIVNAEHRAGEKRYREIYNAPSDAIFIHESGTGKILDVNQGMLDMYGYTYEEALHMDTAAFSSGASPYSQVEADEKIQMTIYQGPQTFDWLAKKKDSTLFWVEVALKYIEISGKGNVIAVVRDVNDRKQAEEALAEEKERLAVTLRSIGDGVITTDVTGSVVMLNKIAEDLTGWTQKEAAGKPLTDVFNIVNEQTRKRCENPADKVLASGEIVGLENHTALIAKDGTERSIADSGAPIRDRDRLIVGVVLVFRDVTEKSRLEAERLKVRKLESVGVLAGGIAHDFNNILVAVLGNINLALTSMDQRDSTHELLVEAEKASLRATKLTQQLLTFAKGGEPVKKLADITEVIEDSASFVLRGSNVRCEFKLATNLWPVEIDSGQISQVIQNIIINAKQAMPQGGMVEISASNIRNGKEQDAILDSGSYVELVIRDNGIGIQPDLLDKIFDPYFTTKQEGGGLGLAITHSIITSHAGHINVTSKQGKGTCFTVYLPAAEGQTVPSDHEVIKRALVGKGKIMVMDDDTMIRELAGRMLSPMGFEVVFAKGGAEAIELYRLALETNDPVDLIIMDLTIPGGMGGKEAVQKIHKLNSEAKVIVASGYSTDPVLADFREYGFCAAIVKPFTTKDLRETVSLAMS